ncbi:unnamed protein product [Cylicocyclus nassatus]|uniref:Uncharacterized protein n=1 Tax=Cylicocyclus nassatus TaxID=53992 RepID=A0AA36HD34_CYLNA|nr:unnamed protein product [Cylicocyclus nassatus]
MQDALTIGIEVLSIIALLLNLIAIHMLSRTRRQSIGSKSIYVIVAVMNIFQLTLFGLSSPVGRPKYRFIYHSVWIIAPVIANFLIILNWNGGVMLQLFLQIHEKVKRDDMHKLSATASLAEASIGEHSYLGFCSEDKRNWIQYSFFLETSVTTVILFAIAIHLAYQVKKKLKEPSLSKRTEQLQRRSSNMLLAQAINLSVLLPAPLLLQPLFLELCGQSSRGGVKDCALPLIHLGNS